MMSSPDLIPLHLTPDEIKLLVAGLLERQARLARDVERTCGWAEAERAALMKESQSAQALMDRLQEALAAP